MSECFLGELRLVSLSYAPRGWALCNGQLMSIAGNQALFSLLLTTYGGDGQTTFALPDLQGRLPVHQGTGQGQNRSPYRMGEVGGEAAHTLTSAEMPSHTHPAAAQRTASVASPAGAVWAAGSEPSFSANPGGAMAAGAIAPAGGGQPHENRPPFLALNWIIALNGIYPSRD